MKAAVRLIVNPVSGKGRGVRVAEEASRILHYHGIGHELLVSPDPAAPVELARAAVRDGCALVVAIGGDGLVNQIGNVLVGTDTVLGIVPAGVGNDFARGVGMPLDVRQASAVIATGQVQRVDVGRINDRYFFSVAVMGLAANVNRRANQFRRFRMNALYTFVTIASVFLDTPQVFTLRYDACTRQCYSWLLAVGNTWSCARGMALVPAARADDGVLDACIVNGMGKWELLTTFPRVFAGRHIYHTGIDTVRGKVISVSAEQDCEVYADGEHLGQLPVQVCSVPRGLKIMLPPQSER
ncbi:MAG: diacylglycerol kinase family protein [Candidatus Binatia bacterium]